MREAIGGTWLLYFFLIFIFVFVAFIAVIMNYASAYRTNNYIISTVENLEGNVDWNNVKLNIKNRFNYDGDIKFCCNKNISSGVVYRVSTYVKFDIPMLGVDLKIPITTDSMTISKGTCNPSDLCK